MFILEVDTATNCHLNYTPIGQLAGLFDLNYVQPKDPPNTSASATLAALSPLATIEPDDNANIKVT
jgi:hypothetical protein